MGGLFIILCGQEFFKFDLKRGSSTCGIIEQGIFDRMSFHSVDGMTRGSLPVEKLSTKHKMMFYIISQTNLVNDIKRNYIGI